MTEMSAKRKETDADKENVRETAASPVPEGDNGHEHLVLMP
jgi:hypothetical protein